MLEKLDQLRQQLTKAQEREQNLVHYLQVLMYVLKRDYKLAQDIKDTLIEIEEVIFNKSVSTELERDWLKTL